MRKTTTSRMAGAAVLVLALSGCGTGDEEQARDALSSALQKSSDNTFQVDDDEADCVAEGMVDEVGVDQLVDYGLLTDDLETSDENLQDLKFEQEDADGTAAVFVDCVDVKQVLVDSIGEGFGGQMTPEIQSCVEEKLTDEVVEGFLSNVFAGDQAAGTKLVTEALADCGPS